MTMRDSGWVGLALPPTQGGIPPTAPHHAERSPLPLLAKCGHNEKPADALFPQKRRRQGFQRCFQPASAPLLGARLWLFAMATCLYRCLAISGPLNPTKRGHAERNAFTVADDSHRHPTSAASMLRPTPPSNAGRLRSLLLTCNLPSSATPQPQP